MSGGSRFPTFANLSSKLTFSSPAKRIVRGRLDFRDAAIGRFGSGRGRLWRSNGRLDIGQGKKSELRTADDGGPREADCGTDSRIHHRRDAQGRRSASDRGGARAPVQGLPPDHPRGAEAAGRAEPDPIAPRPVGRYVHQPPEPRGGQLQPDDRHGASGQPRRVQDSGDPGSPPGAGDGVRASGRGPMRGSRALRNGPGAQDTAASCDIGRRSSAHRMYAFIEPSPTRPTTRC